MYFDLAGLTESKLRDSQDVILFKVLSAKFYFQKPITVHLELFYCFIHFVLYIGQY